MPINQPHVIVLGGPNGAGKTTAAPSLLQGALSVAEFVNADVVATGLSAFAPERAAIQAGRIMLTRLRELAERRVDFAFESTLAGRTHVKWIQRILATGYTLHLFYLWLPTPELAIARVAERVRGGGHDVPSEVVRRRYHAGLTNLFRMYLPLTDTWRFYDNSVYSEPRLLAAGQGNQTTVITESGIWNQILAQARHD